MIAIFKFAVSEFEISLVIPGTIFKFYISVIQNFNLRLYEITIPNCDDFGQ